jgi:hypothetical protein
VVVALVVLLAAVPAARARLPVSLLEENPFEAARYSGQRRQLLVSRPTPGTDTVSPAQQQLQQQQLARTSGSWSLHSAASAHWLSASRLS